MKVTIKINKEEGYIYVSRSVKVEGEFHVDRLGYTLRKIQSWLDSTDFDAPDAPDYIKKSFLVDENYNFELAYSPDLTQYDVKRIIEEYYIEHYPNTDFETAPKRKRELVEMRQTVMVACIAIFKISVETAAAMYGLDHATAVHAKKNIRNLVETNLEYRERFLDICSLLDEPNLINKI